MKITFWGTCGSLPAPLRPELVEEKIFQAILGLSGVDTTDPQAVLSYVRNLPPLRRGTVGGNTPCVEIQSGGETLIVDAGSGLRELGVELMRGPCGRGQGVLHIFLSHLHWDHIQGFPIFKPAFVPGNRLLIYGFHDIHTALEEQQRQPYWPVSLSSMPAQIDFIPLDNDSPLTIGQVQVSAIRTIHPGGSYSYRFQDPHSTVVYACDAEYQHLDDASLQPYIEFFRNADALIFDAQYTLREAWQKVDWGHSSALIGVDMARAARAKKLILSHHEPTYTDADMESIQETAIKYQAQDTSRPTCEVIVAYEGLTLDLTPQGAVDMRLTPDGETAILTPIHTLDQYGVNEMERQLARMAESSSSIIDLAQVETLTTASLQALVAVRQAGGPPIVLAAPSPSVRRVIELSGYQDFFALYPTVRAALEAVQAREALNLPGQVLQNRYQIESQLGEGPLGTVLLATDLVAETPVALKILSPSLSQETLERFMRQSRQIRALKHPNIVSVLDWDRLGEHIFRIEELVTGPTLQILGEDEDSGSQTLAAEQAMSILLDVAAALEYAHSRGVVHGDLKPQNIFLTSKGARLSGFGQGRLEEGRNLLETPLLFLSAAYVAPEQILGESLDARSDLYALGVLAYQLFTGQTPFAGSDQQVLRSHLEQAPRPPRELNPLLSPSLEHLILKLLAKNPNERYAGAEQVRSIFTSLTIGGEETTYQHRVALVGREKQLQTLQACWQEARAGRGQLVFITGESGIGKSSLAQQAAVLSEAPVRLIGQGQEREGAPYHIFSQVLESYFATVPPEFLDEQARLLCANLVRLAPSLRQRLPDLPEPAALQPEHEQLRLMSSLAQFLQRATSERPWLILLDDLQWADSSSLELLRYLGRHLPGMALMVVGIYRDVEVERGHPLLQTLHDLSRHPTYKSFLLDRLDLEGVGQLLGNVWQQKAPPVLVEKIFQHTAGNPFYVEEVAKGLVDDGLVRREEGQWRFPRLEELELPPSVREVVWKRIGYLSADAQTLLSQAAVLGLSFRLDDLWQMSGLPERQALELLDAALERQMVQEISGESSLRFRHPAIRQILYDDLGPLRRRMLHRRAGEVLERRGQPERLATELAHHFAEAGEVERALPYCLQVARQAQTAYANDTAISWYNQTLGMLSQLEPGPAGELDSLLVSAHHSLGEVLTLVGRYEEALAHCTAAWELLEAGLTVPEPGRQRAGLCLQIAQVYERRGDYDTALAWLEKGLGFLDENEPTPELASLYNFSGWVRLHQGLYEVAQPWLERALRLARKARLRHIEAESLLQIGAVAFHLGDYQRYLLCADQALSIHREIGDRRGEGSALNNLGVLFATQGGYSEARSYQEQALHIWREIGDRQAESLSLSNLGEIASYMGDYPGSRSSYEQSLLICRDIGDRRGQGHSLSGLGVIAAGQGDYTRAGAYYEEALRIRREIGDLRGEGETVLYQGNLARQLGDYTAALALYKQALSIHRGQGDRLGETMGIVHLSLLYYLEGDSEISLEYCQQALRLAHILGDQHLEGYGWTCRGHLLTDKRVFEEAAAAYQQALDLRREMCENHLALESLAGLARIALAQGQVTLAQEHVAAIVECLQEGAADPERATSLCTAGGCLDGTDEPFRIYLTCYDVLRAGQDPRAQGLLVSGYELLQRRAAHIDGEEARRAFMENVAAHRELVRLCSGKG